jgi:opacity protein-like surface antigen
MFTFGFRISHQRRPEMKKLMIASSLVLLMLQAAFAQETKNGGQGYVFFAPGVASPGGDGTAHIGVGGELLFKGFGIGPELGYLTPVQSFGNGLGVFSPNLSYHFRTGKTEPFVTGGYSLFFRDGHAHGYNFGGGLNRWFTDRMGVRVEVRDNVLAEYRDTHFWGFRFGLSFR